MPPSEFYSKIRNKVVSFDSERTASLLRSISRDRVRKISAALGEYISKNLPIAIDKKKQLGSYRTNPYVLMTSASVMDLGDCPKGGTYSPLLSKSGDLRKPLPPREAPQARGSTFAKSAGQHLRRVICSREDHICTGETGDHAVPWFP